MKLNILKSSFIEGFFSIYNLGGDRILMPKRKSKNLKTNESIDMYWSSVGNYINTSIEKRDSKLTK